MSTTILSNGDTVLWHGKHGEGELTIVLASKPEDICTDNLDTTAVVLYFFTYAGTKCEGHLHVAHPIEDTFAANFEDICSYIGNHYRQVVAKLEAESKQAAANGQLH